MLNAENASEAQMWDFCGLEFIRPYCALGLHQLSYLSIFYVFGFRNHLIAKNGLDVVFCCSFLSSADGS